MGKTRRNKTTSQRREKERGPEEQLAHRTLLPTAAAIGKLNVVGVSRAEMLKASNRHHQADYGQAAEPRGRPPPQHHRSDRGAAPVRRHRPAISSGRERDRPRQAGADRRPYRSLSRPRRGRRRATAGDRSVSRDIEILVKGRSFRLAALDRRSGAVVPAGCHAVRRLQTVSGRLAICNRNSLFWNTAVAASPTYCSPWAGALRTSGAAPVCSRISSLLPWSLKSTSSVRPSPQANS